MQKLFNLTSAPNVIVQGDRGTQDLQEDTYYSVHRGGVHNATSSSTVLYNGLDGQKHLCSQPHNIGKLSLTFTYSGLSDQTCQHILL